MRQLTQPLTLVAIMFAAFITLPPGQNLVVMIVCNVLLAWILRRRWSTNQTSR